MSDCLAGEVGVLVEMLGEFFLLRKCQQGGFALVTELNQSFFAGFGVLGEVGSDSFFVQKKNFGDLLGCPSGAKERNGFDAVGEPFFSLYSVVTP